MKTQLLSILFALAVCCVRAAEPVTAELKSGSIDDGTARLVFEARLKGHPDDPSKLIYAAGIQHSIQATLDKLTHSIRVNIDVIQGEPKEIALIATGEG